MRMVIIIALLALSACETDKAASPCAGNPQGHVIDQVRSFGHGTGQECI